MIAPVVCYNPIVMILHNQKLDRWHPIIFFECPPPSGELGDGERWKSVGHHTDGFATKKEAINGVEGCIEVCDLMFERKVGGEVYFDYDNDLEWTGAGTPAMVMYFDTSKFQVFNPDEE